jgi:hypothetical protein
MSATFVSVTLAAAGTPQQLSKATAPALPSVISGGVTSLVTMKYFQIVAQASPANTGNVFIGGPALNKTTLSNVGAVLVPGATLNLGQYGGLTGLDDLWADCATSGAVVLLSLVG